MALVMLLMVDWVDHFTVCPLNMVDTMDPRNLRPDDVFMSVFAAPADEAQLEAGPIDDEPVATLPVDPQADDIMDIDLPLPSTSTSHGNEDLVLVLEDDSILEPPPEEEQGQEEGYDYRHAPGM